MVTSLLPNELQDGSEIYCYELAKTLRLVFGGDSGNVAATCRAKRRR